MSARPSLARGPPRRSSPPASERPELYESAIRQLADVNARPIAARFTKEDLLGEGGMGIVWLAMQRSLARHVAIKELRDELKGEVHTLQLLREAWITGSLEHPNIAPVYEIGLDERGSPFVVLKRIEGVHWGSSSPTRPRFAPASARRTCSSGTSRS